MLVEPISWNTFETKHPREHQKVVFLQRESTWYRIGSYYSKAEGIDSPSYLVQISNLEKEYISCENTVWASFEAYDSYFKKYLHDMR